MPVTPPGPALWRWVVRLLIVTTVLAVLAGVAAWIIARRSVPATEGQIRLPGLHAPVEVLYDAYAVPHVYARGQDDAWLVAGWLHGRERLWQMEVYRRATGGRLSELFGEATLPADRRLLALGMRRAAGLEWASAPPHVRTALERYAEGVNAAVAAMGTWRRPLELQLLGVTPEPWTPVDSLSIARLMAWRLAENRRGELVRGLLTRRIGAADAARLMGAWPASAPVTLDGVRTAARREAPPPGPAASPAGPPDRLARRGPPLPAGLEWLAFDAPSGASNSWVVSGRRTASGRPLLVNDPHLAVEMPSIWYELHAVAAGLDVAGVTIPGIPFVIIGHNGSVAWGLTNSGADVQDFYIEEVDMTRRQYLFRGEWHPLRVDRYELGVRGRARPEIFEVFSTRHGPLVADETHWEEVPALSGVRGRVSPRPLALRWDAIVRGETAAAFEAINRAANWTEFLEGVRRFGAPSQNFVYADTGGTIGYAMSGWLPRRAAGDGGTPVPGWTGEYEWVGEYTGADLPHAIDPPSGAFITANAEIDRSWRGTMTRDWTAPFRAARIASMLGDRTGLDADAMAAIQQDVRSDAADRVLSALEVAARSPAASRAEPEARTALDRLRLWDRVADGRPVVSLYHAFERALWRRTFADELPGIVFDRFFEYGLSERWVGLHAILDDPASRWWNDIATVDRRETRDDVFVLAAADAVLALRAKFGDESRWAWDRLHALRFRHALGGGGALLNLVFSRGPVPMVGDSATVNKASIDARSPYAVIDIASYRQILDVGAWDESRAVNTTGQSGHALSAHYFDQQPLWRNGRYRPLPFSRAAVERAQASRLLLVP